MTGRLTDAAADALGLRPGIPVAGGTNDAFASYLGAGCSSRATPTTPAGRPAASASTGIEPVGGPGAFVTPAPLAGRYSVGAAMAATGRALDWFRDEVIDGSTTTERLIEEAAATPPGADGLVFLPYLAGERSPIWDPTATGVLAGLTLAHGAATSPARSSRRARSRSATSRRRCSRRASAVTRCGPAAARRGATTWNQIKADVTGFRVLVPAVLETAVLGSAMLGGGRIGAHADLPTAIRAMTRIDHELEPRPELRRDLRPGVRAYTGLYPAVAPVMRPLAEVGR